MWWLSAISIRRPVFASVLILALVVVGAVSYTRLGVDKFPDVDFPIIVVTTIYPGASPTAVEADVTDKIEAAVNTVSGIDTLSSISTEGANSLSITTVNISTSDVCAVEEGCVKGFGTRNVIRFNTRIDNIGELDYYIGSPSAQPGMFDTQNCHGHAH